MPPAKKSAPKTSAAAALKFAKKAAPRAKRSRHRGTVSLRIDGDTKKLQDIGAAMKKMGMKKGEDGLALKKELQAELMKAAKPVLAAQKTFALSLPRIPKKLKARAARSVRVQTSFGPRNARVTLRVAKRTGKPQTPRNLNAGYIWHPLFGMKKHWFQQPTMRGWFDQPAQQHAAKWREGVRKAVNTIFEKIENA